MNSLTDRDVIDKISEACEAGVEVVMVVRGICCIKAGVPGRTDGLVVRQIVGRFLEHARIYAFGTDADLIYLSSADMMTRNTERRVEIAYPVKDEACAKIVRHFMGLQLADNVKARQLTEAGLWGAVPDSGEGTQVNSQELLLAEAYARARAAERKRAERGRRVVDAPLEPVAEAPSAERPRRAPKAAPAREAAPARGQGRLGRAARLFGEALRTLLGGGAR